MDHAYNVTTHVGPGRLNKADDVQLVQFFMAELLKSNTSSRALRSGLARPTVTGTFDLATAYWVFETQYQKAKEDGGQIDGVVSPIVGGTLFYNPRSQWTIAFLNWQFQQMFPTRFDRLDREPSLSQSLRDSIAPSSSN